MSKRVMGKASFCNVQDLKGNIQCLCGPRRASARMHTKISSSMDIGDIVGVQWTSIHRKDG